MYLLNNRLNELSSLKVKHTLIELFVGFRLNVFVGSNPASTPINRAYNHALTPERGNFYFKSIIIGNVVYIGSSIVDCGSTGASSILAVPSIKTERTPKRSFKSGYPRFLGINRANTNTVPIKVVRMGHRALEIVLIESCYFYCKRRK